MTADSLHRSFLVGQCVLAIWLMPALAAARDAAAPDPRLDRFDANGDGTIDEVERAAVRAFMQKRRQRPGAMTPSGKTDTVGDRDVTDMQYPSSDGRKISAVLSMPRGEGPFPVVVTIHGGQGDRDFQYLRTMAAPNPVSPTVTALNEQSWAVLAISFRSGEGALFGLENDDVVAGIRFAKTLPRIDAARVAVVGGSHGGHLALRAAETMGEEFLCVAVGSPWLTDPLASMAGDAMKPPLSLVPEQARAAIMDNGARLMAGLTRRLGTEEKALALMREQSIEANAEKIVVPALFLTSRADEQVPHVMVLPTIERMQAAGREVEIYTAENSPHGFYWGRSVGGSRIGRGDKTPGETAEEERARDVLIGFLGRQFARADQPAAASVEGDGDAPSPRRTPTPGQSAAIRQIRSRIAEMPIPENLTRRTLTVGGREREFFINVPERCVGRPSPVVFVLHGGASSSGLAMHLKSDFTTLGETEGYVTVYPSGVNGWNIGSHDMYSVKRRTSDADDVGFFRAMFDMLVAEKVADPQRIHVVGGSNGGVMTQFLVCSLADRIAGAGVLVATLPRAAEKDWPKPSRPVPMLVMLGTDDPMKPWDGNRDQMSAAETVAFWRTRNATDAKGKAWDLADRDPADGCRVRAERWEGGAPVVLYTLEGHGHGWPMQRGRDTAGTGPKTRDISAPKELWSFFQAVSPPAPRPETPRNRWVPDPLEPTR